MTDYKALRAAAEFIRSTGTNAASPLMQQAAELATLALCEIDRREAAAGFEAVRADIAQAWADCSGGMAPAAPVPEPAKPVHKNIEHERFMQWLDGDAHLNRYYERPMWEAWQARAALASTDAPCTDPIVESVVAKLRERSRFGVSKYGTTLADSPEGQRAYWLHLQCELLDGANYAEVQLERCLQIPE